MSAAVPDSLRRRVRLLTVGVAVAVAALSTLAATNPAVMTGVTRRAVEATAAAYGTTTAVTFVTLHAPLVFGVVAGAVGPLYVGLLLPGTAPGASADPAAVAAALRINAQSGALATAVALGVPLAVVAAGEPLPLTLLLALLAGLPLGVLALCGATVGTALVGRFGWSGVRLLGALPPAAGVVLVHLAPTSPVWTATAGATFTGLAAVGGGWSALVREELG